MDGVADIHRITPLICPKCGRRVELCTSGHLICWICGELIYDEEHRIWKIREFVTDSEGR